MSNTNLKQSAKIQKISYIHDNTVRKLNVVPDKQHEFQIDPKRLSNQTRKNRDKALSMNAGYVFFLAIAVCITLITCIKYLELQAGISNRITHIAELESQLLDLKSDNDEAYGRITSSIDLENIKKIAMEQYGMIYATKNQVVLYDSKESDYVRQYEDIPSNGGSVASK